jgi:hypothetical protein
MGGVLNWSLVDATIGTRGQKNKAPEVYTRSRKTTSDSTKDSKNENLVFNITSKRACEKICTLHFLTLAPTIGATMRETKASPPRGSGQ